MGFRQRIWPREAAPSPLDLSLTERLKKLSELAQEQQASKAMASPAGRAETAPAPAAASDTATTEVQESGAETVPADAVQPSEHEESAPAEAAAADPGSAAEEEAIPAEDNPEIPAQAETTPVAALPEPAVEVATEVENGTPQEEVSVAQTTPEPEAIESCTAGEASDSAPEKQENGDHAKETGQIQDPSTESRQDAAAVAPDPPSATPAPPSPEKFEAPANAIEPTGESVLASIRQELAELRSARQEFEIEIRDRLDVAIAEYERRLTSEALAMEASGQFEGKTKQATDKIFREVKEQARGMLNAVGNELRTFRDQFGKEVQDRAVMLDEATRRAMRIKEKLDETLPVAEEVLHSLPLAGQEAATQVQAAAAAIADQLNGSHQALSLEIENQRSCFKTLLQDCHQDEMRLREEIEKFRTEIAAASELPARLAEESMERLRAGADEVDARLRTGLESLAGQIEHRLLSPEVVEKATTQIETAAQQQVLEPALECIWNASVEADSAAECLNRASQDVMGRLGAARQQIEARLDALMGEQQVVLESSLKGLHRRAADELGNVVERVVEQSTQQLDVRLHALFDDLLNSTNEHIDGVARTTLSNLHDGLKGIFEPESVEETAICR